jgi:hypothetical protein
VSPERIRVCTLKRTAPTFDRAAIAGWRERLKIDGRTGAVFVGSFQYAPNVRAFEFLRDEVAPELARRDPGLLLLIAGLDSEPFVGQDRPNLRVLGTVDDLDGLLYTSRIGLAPMDVGGGTSTKIVDYLLHGLSVVSTPEAAGGIEATDLMRLAPRSEFVERLIELHRSLRPAPDAIEEPSRLPEFLRRYLEWDDIDAVALEIRRLSAA